MHGHFLNCSMLARIEAAYSEDMDTKRERFREKLRLVERTFTSP